MIRRLNASEPPPNRVSLQILHSALLGVLLGGTLLAGCQRANAPLHYDVQGRVVERTGTHGLTIAHDSIPGFMPPMTMAFIARDSAEVAALSVGDSVHFRWVLGKVAWIENVRVIADE